MKTKSPVAISTEPSANVTKSAPDIQQEIRRRAYEIYEQRGTQGHEVEDWLRAESEVVERMKTQGAG